jgi:glycosyltransferase involved in cell wall biosynthesis
MAEGLTVLVPTKDEEANIRACLESAVDIADELLVADSGSTDATMAIAREFGARIIEREYVNSADMKNWAIPQAGNPWVMVLDADERVTPELARSVRDALRDPPRAPAVEGYSMRRRSFVFGHPIRYSGWQGDVLVRLFRRDTCRYDTRRVHAAVTVPAGRTRRLEGDLLHYTYRDFGHFMAKFDRYTTWSAQDLAERGAQASLVHLLFKPQLRFLKQYVLRQGFRDGIPGLIVCGLSATTVFVRYAKLWVMQHS